MDIKSLVRTIPDYPSPGIQFRDITTLLHHAAGFEACIARLTNPYKSMNIDVVAGIEARGFILGGAVADRLGTGFVPIRKQGKLPAKTIGETYELEYGTDEVEIHADAIDPDTNVLIVDDLIATGGTACAAVNLIRKVKGNVVGACFVIDLPDLGGLKIVEEMGVPCKSLIEFEGD